MVEDACHWEGAEDNEKGNVGLRYLVESHTSLVGIRGIALSRSAFVGSHPKPSSLLFAASSRSSSTKPTSTPTLYSYPAQCNATGARLGLDFAKKIKRADPNAVVLVDAAAYCATRVLDLGSVNDENAPDAIAGSFYKIFGWPTSLGFVIIRRSSSHYFLSTPHFGGGSISSLSLSAPFSVTSRTSSNTKNPTIHQRLGQGTVPFLEIVALSEAMDWFQETYGGLKEVELHVSALRKLAKEMLEELRHEACEEGEEGPVFVEHQAFQPLPSDPIPLPPGLQPSLESPGPTIGFSLLAPPTHSSNKQDFRQTHVGHAHLSRLAMVNGLSLRTGGLCNAGVSTRVFGVDDEELRELEKAGRACWDDQEYSPFYPYRPLGIARISFGAASTVDDVIAFVDFVKKFFVRGKEVVKLGLKEKADSSSVGGNDGLRKARLGTLLPYPIKSCASQSILPKISPEGWPITSTGLLYDREFMLVDPSAGKALSQKKYPRTALILERGILTVQAKGMEDLVLPLPELAGFGTLPLSSTSSDGASLDLDRKSTLLCGELVKSSRVSPLAERWSASFLNLPHIQLCRLPLDSTSRHADFDSSPSSLPPLPLPLRLSNESPFLHVTESSVRQVKNWISTNSTDQVHHSAFRPNLIIDDLDLATAGQSRGILGRRSGFDQDWRIGVCESRSTSKVPGGRNQRSNGRKNEGTTFDPFKTSPEEWSGRVWVSHVFERRSSSGREHRAAEAEGGR